MAQVMIQVSPATYEKGLVTVAYPHTPLCREVHEAKNVNELEGIVRTVRQKFEGNPSKIFLSSVGRKMRGFDKFKSENVSLFEIAPKGK